MEPLVRGATGVACRRASHCPPHQPEAAAAQRRLVSFLARLGLSRRSHEPEPSLLPDTPRVADPFWIRDKSMQGAFLPDAIELSWNLAKIKRAYNRLEGGVEGPRERLEGSVDEINNVLMETFMRFHMATKDMKAKEIAEKNMATSYAVMEWLTLKPPNAAVWDVIPKEGALVQARTMKETVGDRELSFIQLTSRIEYEQYAEYKGLKRKKSITIGMDGGKEEAGEWKTRKAIVVFSFCTGGPRIFRIISVKDSSVVQDEQSELEWAKQWLDRWVGKKKPS
ncbi:unnamed protein product [Vitrella brassicaformis CCMP3155]|uniref:Uncharacterized protein n=2 Tax=Vitrella brassicaformis TaxID=1169539 RepID=A0A0G4H1T5_VITBC|nr:unnamed protein product [Vitrella brassicaformis CCMP3155]|mmetsp:Transcript_54160/g.136282  ORF Transcript_54160/g.136282 Transcript_54160/m.136282 type:complete len:281 (+) Transcript_54160:62-904(+)|eukprot:CEM37585.1 unnamed protein product [Vitrella brassicaformis CCMP3155]